MYTVNGEFIDSCFVNHKEEHVAIQTSFALENGQKVIILSVDNPDEEIFQIFDVCFEKPKTDLFEGGILYQLAPAYAQNMGYVYV